MSSSEIAMTKPIIALVFALASLVPGLASSQGAPASGAVTMKDVQADAPAEYTVVKGDTLWGIAGRFLKEPFKWPLIWQMNRDQIKDPHWIYPGDIIRLDRSGAYPQLSLVGGGDQAVAAGRVIRLEPRTRIEPLATAVPSIPGSAIGPFLTQPLVIDSGGLDRSPRIVATMEERVVVGAGDTAYVNGMTSKEGVNWQIYRTGTELKDPDTGEILGYEAVYLGDARVKRFGAPSTVEITKARQEINRGDRLIPAREVVFPSYVPRAPDKPIDGAIMSVQGGVSDFAQYAIVTINRGSRDGIEVGHVLASFRRGDIAGRSGRTFVMGDLTGSWGFRGMSVKPNPVVPANPATLESDSTGGGSVDAPESSIQLPDERSGLLFVFRTFEKLSYAMVMKAVRPISVGDRVRTP